MRRSLYSFGANALALAKISNGLGLSVSASIRYALAVLVFAIALAIRFAMLPVEDGLAYLTFYPAVALSALLLGAVPGLVTALLSVVVGTYIFIPPFWSFTLSPATLAGVTTFSLSAGIVCYLTFLVRQHAGQVVSSEQRFRDLFYSTPVGQLLLEPVSMRIVQCNLAAAHSFGVSDQVTRIKRLDELGWMNGLSELESMISQSEAHLFPGTREIQIRRHDGELRILSVSLGKLRVAGDNCILLTLFDITDRKTADAALSEALNESSAVYNDAGAGFWSLGADGTILKVNDTMLHWLGYARDEVVGLKKVTDLLTVEGREIFAKEFPAFQRRGTLSNLEIDYRRKDGSTLPAMVSSMAVLDPQGHFLMSRSTISDLTERRQIQKSLSDHQARLEAMVEERTVQLLANEARTRAVLRTMMDAVVHIDAKGKMLTVNDAVINLFGYKESELLGQNVRMLMPEPMRSEHDGYLRHHAESGQGKVLGKFREVVGRRKDGNNFAIELATSQLTDETGTTYIGVMHDITDRKNVETQRELARIAAESSARTKSEFLANMSHEIRTPLNGVLGMARISQRENEGRKTRQTTARLLTSAEHLLRVVDDILVYSKMEAGKLAIEVAPMSLGAILDNVHNLFMERASAKALRLSIPPAAALPDWVNGDAHRLVQILSNLLSNAIKFTAHGDVGMTVARDGDQVYFKVTDTGIGMSEEHMGRLFQPFEQADSSITRNYGGTGLGLMISQRLARQMGGEITTKSQSGAGSTFSLCLPLPLIPAPARSEEREHSNNDTGPRLKGVSVLAADDVEVNRFILEDVLILEGAAVVFAENGQQAVDLIVQMGASAFDIVLMDVQMPVMDGYEATRLIAALAPGLPVIGTTAHALAEERERCRLAGMVDHVTKPVLIDVLVQAILRHVVVRAPVQVPRVQAGGTPKEIGRTLISDNASAGLVDWAGLDLHFKGDQIFVRKLVTSVLRSHADSAAQLQAAAQTGNCDALAFVSHSIRGLGANFHAESLRLSARTLEMALQDGRLEDAKEQAQALAEMTQDFLLELRIRINASKGD